MPELASYAPLFECFEISVLSSLVGDVATVVPNTGGKVMGSHEVLFLLEQVAGKRSYIQPIETLESRLLQPEVEVESVHIRCDTHLR